MFFKAVLSGATPESLKDYLLVGVKKWIGSGFSVAAKDKNNNSKYLLGIFKLIIDWILNVTGLIGSYITGRYNRE